MEARLTASKLRLGGAKSQTCWLLEWVLTLSQKALLHNDGKDGASRRFSVGPGKVEGHVEFSYQEDLDWAVSYTKSTSVWIFTREGRCFQIEAIHSFNLLD